MAASARYVHTNLVARDWKRLAQFYEQVFGCTPILPERELAGQWLEEGTGVADAQIHGVHLRLPGYGDDGPTLEIFQYNHLAERPNTASNCPGFAHIAFAVDDVESARDAVLAEGGGVVGKVVSTKVPGAGTVKLGIIQNSGGQVSFFSRLYLFNKTGLCSRGFHTSRACALWKARLRRKLPRLLNYTRQSSYI